MLPVIGTLHRRKRDRRRRHAAAVITAIGSLVPSSSSSSSSSASTTPTDRTPPSSSSSSSAPREFAYATYHGAGYDGTYGSALPRGPVPVSYDAYASAYAPAPTPAGPSGSTSRKADAADDPAPPSYDDVVPRDEGATCARDGHDAKKCEKGIICRRCGEQV